MYGVNSAVPKTLMRSLVWHLAQKEDDRLKDILIGCYSDNLPSVHIIEKNGGILEEDKSNISWYWIKLKKPRRAPKM